MLRSLYVRDYALIEELEVSFDAGLNVITGETGAGKSILIGAMNMIIGERASTEMVRAGARKAVVEGIFDEVDTPELQELLEDHGIEPMEQMILRREITSSYSRAFINDSPATVQLMREAASYLVDLHGQHEHQSLLHADRHLPLLDNVGGLAPLVGKYREHYERVKLLVEKREQLKVRERDLQQQKELYQFQIEEIDRVGPQEGEEDELKAERRVLQNAEQLYQSTAALAAMLYEQEGALHDQLAIACNELADIARIDKTFRAALDELETAKITVSEIAKLLQDYNTQIEFNPERLEEIRERMGAIDRLKRKYGGTLEAVLEHRRAIGEQYELAADFESAIARLDAEIEEAQSGLSRAAERLSSRRREIAGRVEEAIVAELARLGMPNSRFEIRLNLREDPSGWVVTSSDSEPEKRYKAFTDGIDRGEFLISTNVGEEVRPLARVASGGEISRIMLALKTILAKSDRLPILIFDEIDVGISGSIANKVGESMHDLARYHQIIAITHLPQIAALGDVHYIVEKYVQKGRTKTGIERLDEEQRAEQLAALMSGAHITDATLKSAREMMAAGREKGKG